MNEPLISVIVPVYNVEPYLDRCVESIVNQTYRNLEIILVDDGSPDNCPQMCDAWAERDARIRVIHKENGGSGEARNVALNSALGELVAFVDSDDYIASDMFEYLYSLLTGGADVAECSYIDVFNDQFSFSDTTDDTYTYTVQEAMAEHIRDRTFRQLIWNKLYRSGVIGDIRFPVDKKIDDEFFTYQVLGNAKTLVHSEKICYAYRQQNSSVMHSIDAKKRLQAVEAKVQRHEYIKKIFPSLTELSLKKLWFTCIYHGQLSQKETRREECIQIMKYLQCILDKYPCNTRNVAVKEKMWLFLAFVSLNGVCKVRNFMGIGL